MSYDKRKREVLEELDKQGYDEATRNEFTKVLESYFAQREGRLNNLLGILEPSDDYRHAQWIDKAKDAAAMAHDAISRDKKSMWLAKISNEEHTFFFKLMTSQVAPQRDEMVKKTQALQKAEKEFEEKWKKIRDADNQIEERMKKIALEYEEILNDAAKFAASAEMESKEALRKKVLVAFNAVNLGIVEVIIKGAIRAIDLKRDLAGQRKLEIFALLSREEGVFATFKEARQMVKEFLDETSYPKVKDAYDRAEEAAKALEGQMLSAGQKDDAKDFGSALKSELEKVFRKAEDAYKEFARKHEYLFFGPLGGNYYQELMEDDFWKERSSKWKSSKHDIDDLLRERTLACGDDQVLEVSLDSDGISPEDRKKIREALETHCRDLLAAWNRFKEDNKDPEWALESREQLKSILDAMR
jgi:hypothetical protein